MSGKDTALLTAGLGRTPLRSPAAARTRRHCAPGLRCGWHWAFFGPQVQQCFPEEPKMEEEGRAQPGGAGGGEAGGPVS